MGQSAVGGLFALQELYDPFRELRLGRRRKRLLLQGLLSLAGGLCAGAPILPGGRAGGPPQGGAVGGLFGAQKADDSLRKLLLLLLFLLLLLLLSLFLLLLK